MSLHRFCGRSDDRGWRSKLLLVLMLVASTAVARGFAGQTSGTDQDQPTAAQSHKTAQLPPTPAWGDIGRWDQPQYYSTIQLADIDGDGRAELIGRGPGGILVNHFDPASHAWIAKHPGPPLSDTAHWDQPQYYTTIQLADIDGDGQAELIGRGVEGIEVWHYHRGTDTWTKLGPSGPFSDPAHGAADSTPWNQPQYYTTIRLADIDGDGQAELLGRSVEGIRVYHWDRKACHWILRSSEPMFGDADGWDQPKHYSTIRLADLDGRRGAELIARGPDGLHAYRFENERNAWSPLSTIAELSDAEGWDQPHYYSTIQLADIDGEPGAELIARGPDGLHTYHFDNKTNTWLSRASIPELSDANGWDQPKYYLTIQVADIDGKPGAEVIARGREGVRVWHYNPKAECWMRLGTTMRPDIAGMSDANGWNLPQHYLTIQAANIDGRPGAELIGRSPTGIETWRFNSTSRTATEVTGASGFPAFTGVQLTYYQYISTQLGYGLDVRADYDELGQGVIGGVENNLKGLSPPTGVLPTDPNWQAVKTQISTELTYVETANNWVLGDRGTQTLTTQIFTEVGLNADSVASKLSNVNQSTTIAANLFLLLTKIAQGVAAAAGVPVAPGIASLLVTIFSEVHGNGGAPNLSIAVGAVKGQLATMYSDALNANNDTHEALVTNWSQLQAFAASKVGTVPTDADLKGMRLAGELSYAAWLWETISPAVWHVVIPYYNVHVRNNTCEYVEQYDYPTDGPTYPFNSGGCGPAWIGVDCGVFSCDSVTEAAVLVPFGGGCEPGVDCRDPVNGPLFLSRVDPFLGQNGWNLPCFSQDNTCSLPQNAAFEAERASKAREAIKSLLSSVRTTEPDQGPQASLAKPLEAALAVLKNGGSTQRDFTRDALQNFALQAKAKESCHLHVANRAPLVATAYVIQGQLTDDAPPAVVHTRHSSRQSM